VNLDERKKELDKASEELILKINKEQNLGARRLEKIIKIHARKTYNRIMPSIKC